MLKLMEDYGPIDWRASWAHSLYWATLGDMRTKGQLNIDPADSMNDVRFIFFSLQQGVVRGKMILMPNFDSPFDSYIDFMPDNRYIPFLYDAYLKFGKEQFGDNPRFIPGTPGPNYMNGFVSFLHHAIGNLYREGGKENLQLANKYYHYLRTYNRHPNGKVQERYLVPLKEFILGNLKEELATFKQSTAIIRGFISRSFHEAALGDMRASMGSLVLAKQCYDYYMKDTKVDRNDRRKYQPLSIIRRDELVSYMTSNQVPVQYKARLWSRLDVDLKQLAWDLLVPHFTELCEGYDPPLSMARAFPEPANMEAFRKKPLDLRHEKREDAEQGTRY